MPTVLVIDDDDALFQSLGRFLHEPEARLLLAATGKKGLELTAAERPDIVLVNFHLPDLSGLEVFQRIHAHDPRVPVIVMTGSGSSRVAIEAIKQGAFDFIRKPVGVPQLRELVTVALRVSHAARALVKPAAPPNHDTADALIGNCPAMQEVYKSIGRVAPQDITVLITGESGTGKEVVARAVHQHSKRAAQPFLAINCAAIPETLLESELFGHEKGAFTGADRRRIGKFEQCHGGTLFLDEVGDMAPLTQAKLLRVLQDQAFERVGGNETVRTDTRIIAATNHDLVRMTATGQFRGDLFYRLSTFSVHLPPLRERGDDLPLLVEHFLHQYSRELDKEVVRIAPEALARLTAYAWPGNMRELQSVLKQALLQARGSVLLSEFLPIRQFQTASSEANGDTRIDPMPALDAILNEQLAAGSTKVYDTALEMVDRHVLQRVLVHTDGNQFRAAKILGMTRNKLRAMLRTLKISPDPSQWSKNHQDNDSTGPKATS